MKNFDKRTNSLNPEDFLQRLKEELSKWTPKLSQSKSKRTKSTGSRKSPGKAVGKNQTKITSSQFDLIFWSPY